MLSKGFSNNSMNLSQKSQNNIEINDSTVYYDQNEEEEDDSNFVVVSALVRIA